MNGAVRRSFLHWIIAVGIGGAPALAADPGPGAGSAAIRASDLLARTTVLASDEFEGRGPGTRGEERTTSWLAGQFRSMGLEPGNPDGSWFQDVPMVGMRSETRVTFHKGSEAETLTSPQDFVAWSPSQQDHMAVTASEMVFVGHGVVAPEYGWDDFKDVDVRGKTVVFLINDPPIPDPKDPSKLDDAMFKGKAMTYYGRWTYKYVDARELLTYNNTVTRTQRRQLPVAVCPNRSAVKGRRDEEHEIERADGGGDDDVRGGVGPEPGCVDGPLGHPVGPGDGCVVVNENSTSTPGGG